MPLVTSLARSRMLNLLILFMILSAVVVLLAIILVLSAWLRGSTSFVFPGIGIVVSAGLLLLTLIAVECALVFGAAYLARSKWDTVFDVMQVGGNEEGR